LNEKLDKKQNYLINNDFVGEVSTNNIENNLKSNLLKFRKEIQKDNKNIGKIRSLYKSIDEYLDFVNLDSANVNNFKKFFKLSVNYDERPTIVAVRTITPVNDFIICIGNFFNDILFYLTFLNSVNYMPF
jgi:hypothetical protein